MILKRVGESVGTPYSLLPAHGLRSVKEIKQKLGRKLEFYISSLWPLSHNEVSDRKSRKGNNFHQIA